MTAEKDVQVARKKGRGRGNLGNARKKTFIFKGGLPLSLTDASSLQTILFNSDDLLRRSRLCFLLGDRGRRDGLPQEQETAKKEEMHCRLILCSPSLNFEAGFFLRLPLNAGSELILGPRNALYPLNLSVRSM